jgi:hypothetical protein
MSLAMRIRRLALAGCLALGWTAAAAPPARAGTDEETAIVDLSMALDDLQVGRTQAGLVDLEAAETVLLNIKQSQNAETNAMYARVLHNIDQAHNALVRDDPDPAILLIQSAKAALESVHEKSGNAGGSSQ